MKGGGSQLVGKEGKLERTLCGTDAAADAAADASFFSFFSFALELTQVQR